MNLLYPDQFDIVSLGVRLSMSFARTARMAGLASSVSAGSACRLGVRGGVLWHVVFHRRARHWQRQSLLGWPWWYTGGIGGAAVGAGTFWQAARSSATPVTRYGNDLCIRVSIRRKCARARPVGRALFQSGSPLRWWRRTSHFGIWNSTTLSAKLRIFKLGATGPSDGRERLVIPLAIQAD